KLPGGAVTGWHRHRHRPGPGNPADTTNEGWGLLTGHQRGPRPGHTRGLSHGHGHDVAELVELAQGAPTDDLLEQLDARYSALIPRDQVISDQFKALLQQRPDDFAPASRRTTRPR